MASPWAVPSEIGRFLAPLPDATKGEQALDLSDPGTAAADQTSHMAVDAIDPIRLLSTFDPGS